MASSNDLTTLDFSSIKENLKSYLKDTDTNPLFRDYDFEASNINVLLDVLAYNTSLNGFYLNMIANEMFMDSAILRDSIISHAKELNYVPRSFRSAQARVNLTLRDSPASGEYPANVIIPRGTSFTGTSGNKNFTFTTNQNITANSTDTAGIYQVDDVVLFEGDYVQDSYVTDTSNQPRFLITNKTIDTTSIRVTVIEDNGTVVLNYDLRDSLFGLGASSQVFFLQAAENDSYEILFGDGVIGRPPKNNSIVIIEYRACNGELPNAIGTFTADDNVGTATVTVVETVSRASGGSIPESLESIKFNAPRAFTTQERVVTAQDYATLLKANFSEINDVAAYGGEQFDPPQYGKVIVAIDLKNTDSLPETYRQKYIDFIRPRSPLSIDPVFIVPNYMYLTVSSKVKYDITQSPLGVDDIRSLVVSAIQSFNYNNLNGFDKTLRYSKFVAAIDAAQTSIISNDTDVKVTQFISLNTGRRQNYTIDFDMPLVNDIGQKTGEHESRQRSVVHSDSFKFAGQTSFIEDDGLGNLNIVTSDATTHSIVTKIGEVNYETGSMTLDNFIPQDLKPQLKITVTPREKDITARKRSILRVLDADIKVQVEQVRL